MSLAGPLAQRGAISQCLVHTVQGTSDPDPGSLLKNWRACSRPSEHQPLTQALIWGRPGFLCLLGEPPVSRSVQEPYCVHSVELASCLFSEVNHGNIRTLCP